MNNNIVNWQERFNDLNIRERLLIVLVGIALFYFIFDSVLMSNLNKKQELFQSEISKWGKQNKQVGEQIEIISTQLKAANKPVNNSKIGALNAQVVENEKKLENIIVKFVKPKQIATVLRNILKKEKGLQLMNMKSIEVIELFANDANPRGDDLNVRQRQVTKLLQFYRERKQNGPESQFHDSVAKLETSLVKENAVESATPKIYKHGIMLELVGDYSATLRYLKNMENLPWEFYWDAVRYEVISYPKAKISILINTISLDKEWVRV